MCARVRARACVCTCLYAICARIREPRLRWNRKFVIGGEKNCALKASVRRKEECLSCPVCSTYKEVISPGVEFPSRIAFSFVRRISNAAPACASSFRLPRVVSVGSRERLATILEFPTFYRFRPNGTTDTHRYTTCCLFPYDSSETTRSLPVGNRITAIAGI
uniref:Uncharacterized protein n=1 Tax=Sipha flava TaxID=143950 RepID=A0A2S2R5Z3_9HEMI